MKLAIYLQTKNMSDAEFGRLIDTGRQTVWRYKTGERFPTNRMLVKIFKVTGGKVTPNDFMYAPSDRALSRVS